LEGRAPNLWRLALGKVSNGHAKLGEKPGKEEESGGEPNESILGERLGGGCESRGEDPR